MFKIIQENRQYFMGFCLWLIIGAILQVFFTQNELMLWINHHNNLLLDIFFKYTTFLGDGIFFGACIIFLFLLKKKQDSYIAFTVFALITGVFAYYLKEWLRTPRPIIVFQHNLTGIHLVEGVKISEWFSFPSGHTMSAFALGLIFSRITRHKNLGYFYLLMAVLVGYSRMYLFQHFAVDVYAGAIFGVAFTVMIAYYFEKKQLG